MSPLAILPAMGYSEGVRCGNLASARNANSYTNPEFLAGLCGPKSLRASSDCPAKGPAPLSTWGFSLGECFVVVNASKAWCHVEAGNVAVKPAHATNARGCAREPSKPEISAGHHHKTLASDPQSGLAVGCFVAQTGRLFGVIPSVSEVAEFQPHRQPSGLRHKASLGPEWAALKKHRSSLDNLNLDELARRGPAWRVGQPNHGTKRKSVIFGAVGAYCGGANGPLKSPAFDVVVQVSGHRNSVTAGGSRNPCFGVTMSKEKA